MLDLDNTVYDWLGFYIPSFLSMVTTLSRLTGIPTDELKASFKRVHEKHRTTEYAFAIEELDVLGPTGSSLTVKEVFEKYGEAIEAFRRSRDRTLRLYEGVSETLAELKRSGKLLIALTDAADFYAIRRLKILHIEHYFDGICAPKDPGPPPGVKLSEARSNSDSRRYETTIPLRISLQEDVRKPDLRIIDAALLLLNSNPRSAVLVGDSLSRDIKMAQECGLWDIYAEYGAAVDPVLYEELVKITYWTAEDVSEHERLSKLGIKPTLSIARFADLPRVIRSIEERLASDAFEVMGLEKHEVPFKE